MIFKKIRNFFCRGGRWLRQRYRRFLGKHGILKKRGIKLLNRILSEKSPDDAIFFAGPHLGDSLHVMAYIKAYKEQYPDKQVNVVAPAGLKFVVETYDGFDRLFLLTKKQVSSFENLFFNPDIDDANLSKAIENDIFCVTSIYMRRYISEIPFDKFQKIVLKIDPETEIVYHNVPGDEVRCIENFDVGHNQVVILNPYSMSFHASKQLITFFENVCEQLNGGGVSCVHKHCQRSIAYKRQ